MYSPNRYERAEGTADVDDGSGVVERGFRPGSSSMVLDAAPNPRWAPPTTWDSSTRTTAVT